MDARRCRRAQGGARLREGSGSESNLQPGALEPAARGPGVELAARAVCRPGWSWRRGQGAARGGAGGASPGQGRLRVGWGGASFALSGRVDCARPRGRAGDVSAPPGAGPAPCRLGQSRPRFSTMSKIVLDKMCPNPHDAGLILPYFAPPQRKFAKEFYIFPGKSLVVFIILIRGCGLGAFLSIGRGPPCPAERPSLCRSRFGREGARFWREIVEVGR